MDFGYALVTRIHTTFYVRMQMGFALLEKPEVMSSSLAKSGTDYLPCFAVGHYLRLLRVALLFAGVISPLFFLGRSTGLSVTSTNTTSKLFSRKTFLPGK